MSRMWQQCFDDAVRMLREEIAEADRHYNRAIQLRRSAHFFKMAIDENFKWPTSEAEKRCGAQTENTK